MKYLMVISLILVSGCAKRAAKQETVTIQYVLLFESITGHPASEIEILFGDLDDETDGKCIYDKQQILLNKKHWDNENDEWHEQLILHELGHCVFKFKHDSSTVNGIPVDIMYPYTFGNTQYYRVNREAYLQRYVKKALVLGD